MEPFPALGGTEVTGLAGCLSPRSHAAELVLAAAGITCHSILSKIL